MRSFEIITSEVNRLGSRLQPKWHGAPLIRMVSVCFPDEPVVVVARTNRFGFVGWSFEQSIHIFAAGLRSSRNYKALLSVKLNQARLDGEPHDPGGFAFAADAITVFD